LSNYPLRKEADLSTKNLSTLIIQIMLVATSNGKASFSPTTKEDSELYNTNPRHTGPSLATFNVLLQAISVSERN